MSKRVKMAEKENLKCPICTKLLWSPVYQCPDGHLLCRDCIYKAPNICPTCKCHMPQQRIRNRAIEDIIKTQIYPCMNDDEGCTERFKFNDLSSHALYCLYSNLRFCKDLRIDNCIKPVDMLDLKDHLKTDHKINWSGERNFGEEFQMVDNVLEEGAKSKRQWGAFSLRRPSGPPLLVMVKVRHQKDHTSWLPYIVGSRETSELYECKIDLTGKVKMSWRGVCRNLESTEADRESCFSVSAHCLRGLIMEGRQNNSYEITVRIFERGTTEN